MSRELNSSLRVQILDFPASLPGKCAMCGFPGGEGDGRKFVDVGFDLDFYGVVYFCTHCFAEIATGIEYIPASQVVELNQKLEDLILQNQQLGAENAKLRYVLDSVEFLPRSDNPSSDFSREEIKTSGDNDSKSPEPASKPGRKNVKSSEPNPETDIFPDL
jgi:hypothetical protein